MVVKAHCGIVFGEKFAAMLKMRETGRDVCESALWDCFWGQFAAMLKMRPPKQSHNALENHLELFSRATSKWRITSERVNGAANARNSE